MQKSVIILFFLLIIFSCTNHKKKYLEQLSKLSISCSELENRFLKEKNDSIQIYIQQIIDVEMRIKKYFKADTVSLEFAKKINKFKMVRKYLKPILKKNMNFLNAISEVKQSINLLKHDIENGAGNKEKYKQYIQFEKNKIKNLQVLLSEILETQKAQIKIFYEYYDELNSFSLGLNK